MRIANRVLSLLLGLALAVAGALVLLNLVLALRGQPWWPAQLHTWARGLTTTPWTGTSVRITAACLLAAGLLLLIGQLRRWAPAELPIVGGAGSWLIRRRSAEEHLASAASRVIGAHGAQARLRTRKGVWDAVVTADAGGDLRATIEDSVRQAMTAIGAPDGSRALVRLRRGRRAR